MRRFECGNDAFDAAARMKRRQRLVVGDRHVLRAAGVLEPRMLGSDAGIIETGRDRVRLPDLTVRVLQQIRPLPCSTPGRPAQSDAAWRPVSMPSPAASTPISFTFEFGT